MIPSQTNAISSLVRGHMYTSQTFFFFFYLHGNFTFCNKFPNDETSFPCTVLSKLLDETVQKRNERRRRKERINHVENRAVKQSHV